MILLDTHAWLWWVDEPKKLSKEALQVMEVEEDLGVSLFSCWEVSMLVEKGRLALRFDIEEWIREGLMFPKIKLLNLNPEILIRSTRLPGNLHQDPADRIIVSTAQFYSCSLITKDEKLIQYPHIKTIW